MSPAAVLVVLLLLGRVATCRAQEEELSSAGDSHMPSPQKRACHRGLTHVVRGVNSSSRTEILRVHNILRLKVALGWERDLPPAADMQELVWDRRLAARAQARADRLLVRPDLHRRRRGENVLLTSSGGRHAAPDWIRAIGSWYDEVTHWNPHHVQPFRPISHAAHFTQLVWSRTHRLGCGFTSTALSGHTRSVYVCLYSPPGNKRGGGPVYLKGGACAACPAHLSCAHGLCSERGVEPKQPLENYPYPYSLCPVGTFSYAGRCLSLRHIHKFYNYRPLGE